MLYNRLTSGVLLAGSTLYVSRSLQTHLSFWRHVSLHRRGMLCCFLPFDAVPERIRSWSRSIPLDILQHFCCTLRRLRTLSSLHSDSIVNLIACRQTADHVLLLW